MKWNIELLNEQYQDASPKQVIDAALHLAKRPILTTNFGPFSATLIHALTQKKKDIPVVWIDTGFNLKTTYAFAQQLTRSLDLDLHIFTPLKTAAYIEAHLGIPDIESPNHALFTEKVKIEPFQRAFDTLQPDVWFSNLRKGQTKHRQQMNRFNLQNGVLKVCPFFNYSDDQLQSYLDANNLPNELKYFDPTKGLSSRECGIHLAS